ncbi:MAG: tetratricopeptide repeat protein [Chloroflexi bacterium]|nr:tetratricopeptide repeat protein [Chloroflexota bacterium]
MATSPPLLRIFLLGSFRVVAYERAIEPNAWRRLQRAQQLVKMLALAPRHRLGIEHILDVLWREAAPDAARHSLHQAQSVARKILGATPQARANFLIWENDWMELCRDDRVWVDAEQFQMAAEQARRTQTIDAYQAALGLYRGELAPDDRYADWARTPREELHKLKLDLQLELAALYQESARESDARALLERIIADDPLGEHQAAHRALMQFYIRKRQPHSARRVYEKLCAALREVDLEPEDATQQLHKKIRTRQSDAPAPALPPIPLTSFIGRAQDCAAVEQRLRQARLVTLTGPAGCGKTRLALECAHVSALDSTVYWIELAPLADATLLPNVIANRLGIQEQGPGALEQRLLSFLRNDAALLILDNCEHLLPAVARLTKTLLERCSGLKILATSRERLRVTGESVWQIGSLKYPRDADPIDDDTQQVYAAVQLFVERAQAIVPTFVLTPGNGAAVAAICRHLEGIPLALELAAARVNVLSAPQIETALDDALALSLLTRGERAQLPRHQSLRAALDWSFNLLDDAEKGAWQRLAVFRGDFSLAAALAVCGESGERSMRELLASLIDKSIVQTKSTRAEMRYRLLETTRQYGLEKLEQAGEAETRRAKHYTFFCALAERADAGLGSADQMEWVTRLDAEMENLRAALQGTRTFPDALLRLCAALWRYWYVRGWLSEGRGWLEDALRRARVESAHYARALVGVGALCWAQGDLAQATQSCERGLEMARAKNDVSTQGWAQLILGMVAQYHTDLAAAAAWQTQSLAAFEQCGEPFGRALALHTLGITLQVQGKPGQARECFEASLELHRQIGSVWGIAFTQHNLGALARSEGKFAEAHKRLQESLTLFGAFGFEAGLGMVLNNLGLLALQNNQLARAAVLFRESLYHSEKIGDQLGMALSWSGQALLNLLCGDYDAARTYARRSLQLRHQVGDPMGVAGNWEVLAQIAAAQKQFARAAQLAGAAHQLRLQIGTFELALGDAVWAKAEDEMRQHLGQAAFEREWQCGAARTVEASVRAAMED